MVAFTAVQHPLHVAPQGWGIAVVEQIQRANDIVIFPQRPSRFVFASIRTEFSHDNALGGRFQDQKDQDALYVLPLFDDKLRVEFAHRLEYPALIVLAGMLESVEDCADLLVDIPVARCELIPEDMEQDEIHLVGPM